MRFDLSKSASQSIGAKYHLWILIPQKGTTTHSQMTFLSRSFLRALQSKLNYFGKSFLYEWYGILLNDLANSI
jgi:hypothetical protein